MAWKKRQLTTDEIEAATKRKKGLLQLSKDISEMTEEQKRAFCKYLDTSLGGVPVCNGQRVLSAFNSCFLMAQMPTVTVVGGFQQWKEQGRQVKKGEKAMAIWIRVNGKQETDSIPDGETPEGKPGFVLRNCMFDISQTEALSEQFGEVSDSSEALALTTL